MKVGSWEDDLGVSKNRGTPKWMVKIMENPIKMDDLGGKPTIFVFFQLGDFVRFHVARMSAAGTLEGCDHS